MTLPSYDTWKCTPPAEADAPASDPHDACEAEITELQHRIRALENALAGKGHAWDYTELPVCAVCFDGRPNADCICNGTGRHYECSHCGAEHHTGLALVLYLPAREPFYFDRPACMAAAIEDEIKRPRVGARNEGELTW